MQHAGEFDRDVAAADHGDPARAGIEREEAVRIDAEVAALELWSLRPRASRDHDMPCLQHAVTRLDAVCIEEPAARRDHVDAGLVEALPVARMDAFDVTLAMRDECRPVEGNRIERKADRRSHMLRMREFGREPHRLLRYAADIDAGSADRTRFNERH